MASSRPSSAQWMSSNAITNGCRFAIASMPPRRAARKDSRMRSGSSSSGTSSGGTSTPSSRPISAASRSEVLPSPPISSPTYERSLPQASSEESDSTIPHSSRSTSPSAQNTMPLPYGRQRPVRTVGCDGWLPEAHLELAQQARLAHARLAHDRDEVRRSLADHALVEAVERGQLLLAPHERRLPRRRHAPHRVLRDQPDRLPGGHGLGLPLQRERLELLVAHGGVRGAHGPLADRHASRAAPRSGAGTPRSRCRPRPCRSRPPRPPAPRRCSRPRAARSGRPAACRR